MRWIKVIYIFVFLYTFHVVNADLNVPALLANEKNTGAGGTLARITRKGINYVATVLTQNLIPEIINAQLNEEPNKMEIEKEAILVSELSITVAELKTPVQTDILPPNLILLDIPGLNLTSNLQITGNISGLSLDAVFSIRSEDTVVHLGINPMRTSTGSPNLRIQDCSVKSVKSIQLMFSGEITDTQKTLIQPALEKEAVNFLNDLVCNRIIFIVEERVNDRFSLLPQKIELKHKDDEEIIKDLSNRLRSRRQRREENDDDLLDEETSLIDMSRLLRVKRQFVGMRIPVMGHMGAGFGRRKRSPQWAGMHIPVMGRMGAGFGRRRRSPQWAGMHVPVMGRMGAGFGRRRRSPQWAGMHVPVMGRMGAGFGRRKREAPWDMASGATIPTGMNMGRKKRQWAGMHVPVMGRMGAGFGRRKRQTQNLIAGINVASAKNLALDYTIVSDINVTKYGLEIESSGETSIHGRGGTPFSPVKVLLPESVNEDSMLQMIVSDYMPNSLIYHGHTTGLFNTRVDPSTSHLGSIMRTTCSLSTGVLFCLGDLFPTLKRLHPNRKLALNFNTIQAPVIRFHTTQSGGIMFNLLGRIVFMVIDPDTKQEKEVAQMSIDVFAHMKLRLSSSMVRPKITLEKIKLATLTPGILHQDELDSAVTLSREVLQRMVNDILKDGIPIPVHPLFKLVKPKVKVLDRALLLQTNFELNEHLVKQITTGDFRKRA